MRHALAARPLAATVDWLIDGARSAPMPDRILAELCERFVAAGVPLWRAGIFVRTLHPQVMGVRILWLEGAGVEMTNAPHELLDTIEARDNLISQVIAAGTPIRVRLAEEDRLDSALLAELKAAGATDYLATPLVFSDGSAHAATWATRQPGGFTASEIAAIEAILKPLARVAEIRAWRRTARNLLDTYVGHQAGERILSGRIRRGDSEAIRAAIWLSDMRGFTALADRLPPRQLLDLLNRYFDCQLPAIDAEGGEVLKFIGDGLLAIFPIAEGASPAEGCAKALAAALAARERIAALDGEERLRFGLGLHLGEVLYGNIGSGSRLDFTCIGPAVNLSARIEKLAARLGRTVLASEAFAYHCPSALVPLGEFRLPGVGAAQRIFGLADEA
jgi:adenylate cyclase